jgi:L-threonylcarbamoyladenylate synthase
MIKEAARTIIGGGVVAYPTETVYGLGANALDEQAILRVYQIKKRPLSMPIFLAVSNFEMLESVANVDPQDMAILEQLMPGPVSVLVPKKSIVPNMLTAGSSLVGVRFPDHETALRITELVLRPQPAPRRSQWRLQSVWTAFSMGESVDIRSHQPF